MTLAQILNTIKNARSLTWAIVSLVVAAASFIAFHFGGHQPEMDRFDELKNLLKTHGQEHVLKFWDVLSQDDRNELLEDLQGINIPEVVEYFKKVFENQSGNKENIDDRLKPIPSSLYGAVSRTPKDILNSYEEEGLRQISEGRVGVLLMAGGQGTRLGSTDPKGMFDVGLPSRKTLYQIQAERIIKISDLAKERTGKRGYVTWIIMTSEHTMAQTKEFFVKNNYFGLDKNNIIIFEQGLMPCFTFDGKFILDKPHRISLAPDGNGGLYRALKKEKILDLLENRGVKYLHAHSVDNILTKVADPVFIGYCVRKGAECGNKVVEKAYPAEPLGVLCSVDGKFQVVEYSEISKETAEKRNNDGKLTFSAGNICNHFFTTAFLRKIADSHEKGLKLHVAEKKVPYIGDDGKKHKPEKVNGIKLEKFVFDVFQFSANLVVWEVKRDEEFSALKNGDNAAKDSPATAKKDLLSLHKRFVLDAGGKFDENGSAVCEISPLVSYAGEGLETLVKGKILLSPLHLASPKEKFQTKKSKY